MVTALDGSTPLHVAANKGNYDIMELLLQTGIRLKIFNKVYYTVILS